VQLDTLTYPEVFLPLVPRPVQDPSRALCDGGPASVVLAVSQ